MGGPVLDDGVLFGSEIRHRAVGPDLPELVVERLVGHHQLHQLAAQRIVQSSVKKVAKAPMARPSTSICMPTIFL